MHHLSSLRHSGSISFAKSLNSFSENFWHEQDVCQLLIQYTNTYIATKNDLCVLFAIISMILFSLRCVSILIFWNSILDFLLIVNRYILRLASFRDIWTHIHTLPLWVLVKLQFFVNNVCWELCMYEGVLVALCIDHIDLFQIIHSTNNI